MLKRIIVVATLAAAPTLAAEQTVEIASGQERIVGILNLPDGSNAPPVVLMLHGFTGQKNEFTVAGTEQGLYAFVAAELDDAGIASLRIDFTGSGESSGDWVNTTFSGQTADAVAAFDYLETLDSVDGSRIGILGYSQGGLVGAHVAGARPETKAVVLWAPVTNPIETYSTIMGRAKIAEGLAATPDQEVTASLSWGGTTTLKGSFFHEMPTISAAGAIAPYEGPLRVIVGAKETIVAPQPNAGQQLLRYHEGVEDLVILDTDHDFGGGTSSKVIEAELSPHTIEWFQQAF